VKTIKSRHKPVKAAERLDKKFTQRKGSVNLDKVGLVDARREKKGEKSSLMDW